MRFLWWLLSEVVNLSASATWPMPVDDLFIVFYFFAVAPTSILVIVGWLLFLFFRVKLFVSHFDLHLYKTWTLFVKSKLINDILSSLMDNLLVLWDSSTFHFWNILVRTWSCIGKRIWKTRDHSSTTMMDSYSLPSPWIRVMRYIELLDDCFHLDDVTFSICKCLSNWLI